MDFADDELYELCSSKPGSRGTSVSPTPNKQLSPIAMAILGRQMAARGQQDNITQLEAEQDGTSLISAISMDSGKVQGKYFLYHKNQSINELRSIKPG